MMNPKILGLVVTAFVAGSFVSSPELRAYAVATITSADIVNETIQSVDIRDGEVKASDIAAGAVRSSEIATNAVGASELIGVTKLMFVDCPITDNTERAPGGGQGYLCSAPGTDIDDNAIGSNSGNSCFQPTRVDSGGNAVLVILVNVCTFPIAYGTGGVSIIVYDT
ncbi:MAG: hypothetical protein ACREBU_21535 [Nitrososphaera sp.]